MSNGNLCMFHMYCKADVFYKKFFVVICTNWLISSQDPHNESWEEKPVTMVMATKNGVLEYPKVRTRAWHICLYIVGFGKFD